MLQRLNSNIKGWVAGVIFVVISSTFVLWGVQYYMQAREKSDHVVASVNGVDIPLRYVSNEFLRLQQKEGYVASNEARKEIKSAIVSRLITQFVQNQAAKSLGFTGGVNQFAQSFSITSMVMPYEIKKLSQMVVDHNRIAYLVIPLKHFLSSVASPSADKIRRYYRSHGDEFRIPAKVRCEYLEVSAVKIKQSIKISDERAREYYEMNPQTLPATWDVERLVVPVDHGVPQKEIDQRMKNLESSLRGVNSLSDVIVKHPKWHLNTQRLTSVHIPASLLQVFSGLKKGRLSSPVYTSEGINFFKVLRYSPERQKPFSQVRGNIKRTLVMSELSKRLNEMREKLTDITYTQPHSLSSAANVLKLKVRLSDWMTAGQGSGLFSDDKLRAMAFSNDVLVQKNNSSVVSLKNGDLLVFRVSHHVPSRVKLLSDVKLSIISSLKKKEAMEQAGKKILLIAQQMKSGVRRQHIASELGLTWKVYRNTGAATKLLSQLALIKAYNLPASDLDLSKYTLKNGPPVAAFQAAFQVSSAKPRSLGFANLTNGDSVVAMVLPSDNQSRKVKPNSQSLKQFLEQLHARKYFQIFMNNQMKVAKIKRFPEVLKSIL